MKQREFHSALTRGEIILSAKNVSKVYGSTHALKGVNFDIRRGEVTTLFGENGAGKSTLMKILSGVITPSSGEILVDGNSLVNVPPHKRDIGMVFQRYSLFPHLNVRDNIAFPLAIRKLGAAETNKRVDAMLKLVQLEKFAHRKPSQMSGGQQQRVAIARALVYEPRILLMDEPLASVDAARREEILGLIERIRDELRLPILYVSHDRGEVERLAQQIVPIAGLTAAASTG